jgi:hypothetical protein
MATIDLKSNIHKIIDQIESEQLLQVIYDFLKDRQQREAGQLWSSLSEEQKSEVLKSYEESEEDRNLIHKDNIFPSAE